MFWWTSRPNSCYVHFMGPHSPWLHLTLTLSSAQITGMVTLLPILQAPICDEIERLLSTGWFHAFPLHLWSPLSTLWLIIEKFQEYHRDGHFYQLEGLLWHSWQINTVKHPVNPHPPTKAPPCSAIILRGACRSMKRFLTGSVPMFARVV